MQSILMMAASAAALLHTTMVSSGPMVPDGAPVGPMPQNGVWALLPTACAEPTSLDLSTWAACATPIAFADDEVAALEKPGPGKKATPDEFYSIARTKFTVAPGLTPTASPLPAPDQTATATAPAITPPTAIAQIVVPMVFSRSYYYLAIAPMALDEQGRFAAARGWPVACLPRAQGGCIPKTLADVQTQAAIEPTDPQRLYRLIRIRPAAAVPADAAPSTIPSPTPGSVTETPLPPATPPPAPSSNPPG